MSYSYTLPPSAAPPATPATQDGVRDLYGYDIAHRAGDFPLTPGGDYIRLGGDGNLRQAIYRRLVTRPGEFRYRPDYGAGIQTYVYKAASKANLDAIRQRVIGQLSLDPRLADIDVTTEFVEINSQQVLKLGVRAVVGGARVNFEPFSFAKET